MSWETDTADFAKAVAEFEAALPGFWWSVGQCSVGAHASCAVDGNGVQKEMLDQIGCNEAGQMIDADGNVFQHPYNDGFHVDTNGGSPADALRAVMRDAVKFMEQSE
jgi:hypothetical protein